MLKNIINLQSLGGRYAALCRDLEERKPLGVTSLTFSEKVHLAALNPYFTLYVTPDRLSARNITARIQEYLPDGQAVCLPEREDILMHRHISGLNIIHERTSTLAKILSQKVKVLVMPVEAMMQYYPEKELFKSLIFTIRKNDTLDIKALTEKLIAGNYKREERVLEKGSFSLRGDILEIFPIGYELPVRISLFDDTVEYIKVFEPESMLSTGEEDEILIAPASDLIIPEQAGKEAVINIRRVIQSEQAKARTDEIIGDIKSILELHPSSPSLVWLIPYLDKYLSSIFNYLPENSLIIFDEPKSIDEKAALIENEHLSRLNRFISEGESLSAHKRSLISKDAVYDFSRSFRLMYFQMFNAANPVFNPLALYNFKGKAVSSYYLDFNMLIKDIKLFLIRKMRIVICAGDRDRAENLILNLKTEGLGAAYYEDLPDDFTGLSVIPERLSNGIFFTENSLIVIGTNDVFRQTERRSKARRKRSVFTIPEKGDFVVHEIHGIGKCEGIVTLTDRESKKDYVLVSYKDSDKLYVPIDQLDMLERYSGGDDNPTLSKIGGKEFEKIKESVKKSVKKLAIDLLDIYSKREKQEGVKYPQDTPWQKEFEDSFPYEETADQLEAVKEIKADMEEGRVMDRLICGDVGYGKTEVALRAVFKTVMGGKQAAVLAPTTILAEQHFITALDRFKPFGVKCAVLSRFIEKEQMKKTVEGLKKGEVDVVIATHRLLSKDVEFKDLGLLVLDEEQRFGVEHKEKIKSLKININVLTLTATPIPRTLNMALTGVRDISVLETPPVGRLPVATYITEFNDALILDACGRELNREGQVIILYNNVATIEQFSNRIRSLLPKAQIEVAHGQMSDSLLEKAIGKIYDKKADILICSTIIENGIDLPDANTLIVVDSDKLGLTELYQLRGRVGRRDRLAYAYFTVREGKVLTSDAMRRLEALAEYTEFGSGFKIAMKDLEIRGAGNILGREQHGHIGKVGYEMYCKLLDEAVKELKGEEVVRISEVEVIIKVDAYLTDEEAGGQENKMKIYKKIAGIRSPEDIETVTGELKDILKKIDDPLKNLIDISYIRALAGNIGASKVTINDKVTALTFEDIEKIKSENILYALSQSNRDLVLSNSTPPSVIFNLRGLTIREKMDRMIKFLLNANGIY